MWVGYPIFFGAADDTLCIPSRAFFDELLTPLKNAWYQLLSGTSSDVLKGVKILDIVDVDCLHKLGLALRLRTPGEDVDFLRFFTGLNEVGILPSTEYRT